MEFRLFNGTTHAGRIKAYIQFCLAMSAWSINCDHDNLHFKSIAGYTQQQNNYRDILVGFAVINDRVALCKLVKVQKNAMQVILHSVTEPAHTTGASAPRSGPSIGSPG